MRSAPLAALSIGALLLAAMTARATTLHVPGEYPTISLAVAAAVSGDSVAVGAGTWTEGAEILVTVSMTLYSTAGAQATVLDGQDSHRVLRCIFPGEVVIRGFSFVRGRGGTTTPAGGAILAAGGAAVTVEECEFRSCFADHGGAFYVAGSPTTLAARRCTFEDNTSTVTSGAAYIVIGALATFADCTFRNNETITYAGAVQAHRATMSFERCLFEGNRSGDVAGALYYGTAASGSVRACTFFDHVSPGRIAGTIVAGSGTEITANVFGAEADAFAVTWYTGVGVHSCNVFWDNAAGAMNGAPLDDTETMAHPLFCDPEAGDFHLRPDSPCLPDNSGGCGLIGAFGQGCGPVSLEVRSWGSIKAGYR
jgi:hypothetical protein